jgi:hypothetical protein
MSIIFVTQNLFKQGKAMRDIALNCQVQVLFKNPRDVNQVKLLGRQLGIPLLHLAYTKAVKKPFGAPGDKLPGIRSPQAAG